MEKLTEEQKKAVIAYGNLLDVNTRVGKYFPRLDPKTLMKTVAESVGFCVEETEDLITSAIEKNPSEVASYIACLACRESHS